MTLYQHRFHGTLPAGDQFVFSWWANSTRNLADAQTAALDWLTDFTGGAAGFASKVTDGVVFDRVTTGDITLATGHQTALAEDVVVNGGSAAPPSLPQEVSTVVSLRTSLANKSGRGRFYLPPLASSKLTNTGKLDIAVRTDILNALTAAWTNYNTVGNVPVVYSRRLRATNNITHFNIGDIFDVQTRRDNKVLTDRSTVAMP